MQKSGAVEVAQSQVVITVMNRGTYRVKTNSVAGIENTLRNAPDIHLKEDTKELEKATAKLAEVANQLGTPFAQQAEMEETRRRLEKIDAEINGTTYKSTTSQVEENEKVADEKPADENETSISQEKLDELFENVKQYFSKCRRRTAKKSRD